MAKAVRKGTWGQVPNPPSEGGGATPEGCGTFQHLQGEDRAGARMRHATWEGLGLKGLETLDLGASEPSENLDLVRGVLASYLLAWGRQSTGESGRT